MAAGWVLPRWLQWTPVCLPGCRDGVEIPPDKKPHAVVQIWENWACVSSAEEWGISSVKLQLQHRFEDLTAMFNTVQTLWGCRKSRLLDSITGMKSFLATKVRNVWQVCIGFRVSALLSFLLKVFPFGTLEPLVPCLPPGGRGLWAVYGIVFWKFQMLLWKSVFYQVQLVNLVFLPLIFICLNLIPWVGTLKSIAKGKEKMAKNNSENWWISHMVFRPVYLYFQHGNWDMNSVINSQPSKLTWCCLVFLAAVRCSMNKMPLFPMLVCILLMILVCKWDACFSW